MRIRIESPLSISAGLFKPVRVRTIGATGNTVHWYDVNQRDLDTFLREIFHYYNSNYDAQNVGRDEYVWYASMTLYYRGTTVSLNLSYTRLYDCNDYRLQYRQELDSTFGFWPESIEFWQFDSARNSLLFANVRKILNNIVKGVAK